MNHPASKRANKGTNTAVISPFSPIASPPNAPAVSLISSMRDVARP